MRPLRKKLLIATATVVVGGSLIAALTVGNSSSPQPIAINPGAGSAGLPDATGTDPVSGKPVSFAQFRGKPLFINLWASWCPGCNDEAADIARFVKDHPEVGFVGVDVQDTVGDAKAFYAKYSWQHPTLFDQSSALGARLGLQGLPTTIVVDASGRIVANAPGVVTYDSLSAAAKQLTGPQ